jgi:hypothetical protein
MCHPISHNLKIAAIQLYEQCLLDLKDMLNCAVFLNAPVIGNSNFGRQLAILSQKPAVSMGAFTFSTMKTFSTFNFPLAKPQLFSGQTSVPQDESIHFSLLYYNTQRTQIPQSQLEEAPAHCL